jgi:hypothetical protein
VAASSRESGENATRAGVKARGTDCNSLPVSRSSTRTSLDLIEAVATASSFPSGLALRTRGMLGVGIVRSGLPVATSPTETA